MEFSSFIAVMVFYVCLSQWEYRTPCWGSPLYDIVPLYKNKGWRLTLLDVSQSVVFLIGECTTFTLYQVGIPPFKLVFDSIIHYGANWLPPIFQVYTTVRLSDTLLSHTCHTLHTTLTSLESFCRLCFHITHVHICSCFSAFISFSKPVKIGLVEMLIFDRQKYSVDIPWKTEFVSYFLPFQRPFQNFFVCILAFCNIYVDMEVGGVFLIL